MAYIKTSVCCIATIIVIINSLCLIANSAEIKLSRVDLDDSRNEGESARQSSTSSSSNWPMHQYNAQHTGHNNFSAIELPLQLRWAILDTLHKINQVSVADDKLLITYGRGAAQSRAVCLDVRNGSLNWLWYLGTANSVEQPGYGYGNVYVQVMNFGSSYMVAFDLISGDSIWITGFSSQSQDYLGPTVHQGRLLFGGGTFSRLYCLDANDGTFLWNSPGTIADEWTPAAHKDTVYGFIEQVFWVGDLITGQKLWSINADTIVKAKMPPIEALQTEMGVSPVIDTVDNIAYCMDAFFHYLFAIDFAKREMIWIDSLIPHGYGKTPAIYENLLFLTNWGYMQIYNRFTGEKLWQFAGDDTLRYAPVIANGYVFVSSLSNTFAIDIQTQQLLWTYPAGGHLTVSGNRLYVADSLRGSLYAFGDLSTPVEENEPPVLPSDFALYQNFPNPFNPSTQIGYTVPRRSLVEISIYNSLGQHVKTLIKEELSAGNHTIHWNGTNKSGKTVPSGVYFYKMIAGDFIESKKMTLVK